MSLGEAAAAEVVRKPTAQMMVLPRQWAEMSNCSSVQAATARNQGNHRQNWGNCIKSLGLGYWDKDKGSKKKKKRSHPSVQCQGSSAVVDR